MLGEVTVTETYRGWPCSDWVCSGCGKTHNSHMPGEYCPRCGRRVVRVEWASGRIDRLDARAS